MSLSLLSLSFVSLVLFPPCSVLSLSLCLSFLFLSLPCCSLPVLSHPSRLFPSFFFFFFTSISLPLLLISLSHISSLSFFSSSGRFSLFFSLSWSFLSLFPPSYFCLSFHLSLSLSIIYLFLSLSRIPYLYLSLSFLSRPVSLAFLFFSRGPFSLASMSPSFLLLYPPPPHDSSGGFLSSCNALLSLFSFLPLSLSLSSEFRCL